MIKKYFFTVLLTLSFSTISLGQDIVIVGIIDGPLPGGLPKALELYVVNYIADLSVYGLERAGNGATASYQSPRAPVPRRRLPRVPVPGALSRRDAADGPMDSGR